MTTARQVNSAAPKKSISLRMQQSDLELIKQAATIADESFQRFAIKRLLKASAEVIRLDKQNSTNTER